MIGTCSSIPLAICSPAGRSVKANLSSYLQSGVCVKTSERPFVVFSARPSTRDGLVLFLCVLRTGFHRELPFRCRCVTCRDRRLEATGRLDLIVAFRRGDAGVAGISLFGGRIGAAEALLVPFSVLPTLHLAGATGDVAELSEGRADIVLRGGSGERVAGHRLAAAAAASPCSAGATRAARAGRSAASTVASVTASGEHAQREECSRHDQELISNLEKHGDRPLVLPYGGELRCRRSFAMDVPRSPRGRSAEYPLSRDDDDSVLCRPVPASWSAAPCSLERPAEDGRPGVPRPARSGSGPVSQNRDHLAPVIQPERGTLAGTSF
jgi:hypothetical protein